MFLKMCKDGVHGPDLHNHFFSLTDTSASASAILLQHGPDLQPATVTVQIGCMASNVVEMLSPTCVYRCFRGAESGEGSRRR
jgi:hypothetical protein